MNTLQTIDAVLVWARRSKAIEAVALVGSHARGTAHAASDIDLMVMTACPDAFRADPRWCDDIPWPVAAGCPVRQEEEEHGAVWSRRLWLAPPVGDAEVTEVEISFGLPSWADIQPVDSGTWQVILGGCRILHDPHGLLERLVVAVRRDHASTHLDGA